MGPAPGQELRMRGRRYTHRGFTEINITPFVDVMLVLLIIFMVTAPMMTTGVTVELPDSAASPIAGQDEPISITITRKGNVYIQKTKVPLKKLRKKLLAITKQNTNTRIFIRGDKRADYGNIMKVVGEINAAGYNKVALLTEVNK